MQKNPLLTFPCMFPIDGEVANLLVTDLHNKSVKSWQQVVDVIA